MINQLLNQMRLQASLVQGYQAVSKIGIITNYNPDSYSVRVKIMPEEAITGDLPYASIWAGNGWGDFSPPIIGNLCLVICVDGSYNNGIVLGVLFNDEERPLSVPSGERWLVHQSGSFIKLTNDGKVLINGSAEIDITSPKLTMNIAGDITINASGTINAAAMSLNLTGDTNIAGNLAVSGEITDLAGTKGTIDHIRTTYNAHTHGGVQTGGGNTSGPSEPL